VLFLQSDMMFARIAVFVSAVVGVAFAVEPYHTIDVHMEEGVWVRDPLGARVALTASRGVADPVDARRNWEEGKSSAKRFCTFMGRVFECANAICVFVARRKSPNAACKLARRSNRSWLLSI